MKRRYDTDEDQAEKELGQWARFEKYVRKLNDDAGEGESVKVLFLGRHGQGWHNVAESKYGTKNWDVRCDYLLVLGQADSIQCYYSMLDGADGIVWSDAVLTDVGQGQARDVNGLWKEQLRKGMPAPETYYVSPLTRTMETADLSFKGLELPQDKPYRPYIKEVEVIHQRRGKATDLLHSF